MKKITTQSIIGLLIVIFGAVLLLSNLGVSGAGDIFSTWWPLLVVAIGIIIFVNNKKDYLWALVVFVFGIALQLDRLDFIEFNFWQLIWPILIITIGISIATDWKDKTAVKANKVERQDVTAVLSGNEQKNSSANFKGSKVTAILGGAQLDLRKAKVEKEATIEVFAFCGGIEIFVPKDVIVKNQITNILGGTEDNTEAPTSKDAPILNIVGSVIMAGVEIKS